MVRFFLNATAFFTCDFVKLFTQCDCDLCRYILESHMATARNGYESLFMCDITVLPYEQSHRHPHNSLKNAVAFRKNCTL